MRRSKEFAEATTRGEAALKAMAASGVPPTPQNYSVWYAYVAGTLPELKQAIDSLRAEKQLFTPDVNDTLYSRYIDAAAHSSQLQEAGSKLHFVVDQVQRLLGTAAGDASSFGRTLDGFSAAIDKDGQDVHTLISDLVTETGRMTTRNAALERRLQRASSEVESLQQNLQTVQREALTDSLTGIPNRKSFDVRLREAARDAVETGEPLSLLIADVDHFKRFNDTYGHQLGDDVLRLVARMLSDTVKGRDTPARYGGEEFAIVLPQTALRNATIVAEQIRNTLARHKLVSKLNQNDYGSLTLSFGAAQYRQGETTAELISRADAALYLAKHQGRNRVATEEMLAAEPVA